jgi:hypothetical protein
VGPVRQALSVDRYVGSKYGVAKKRMDPRTFADAVAINNAEKRDSYVCAEHAPVTTKGAQKPYRSGVGAAEANGKAAGFVEARTDCCAICDADPADFVKRSAPCPRCVRIFQKERAEREGEKG